jgi:hypothetical protein
MIEGKCDFTTDSGRFMLSGGNHITNDLDIHYGENGQYTIEFNRNCNITMTFWLAWKSKATAMSGSFIVSCQQEGAPVQNRSYHVDGDVFRNNVHMFTWTFNAHAGDSMNFNFIAFEGDYTMCNFLCDATITNYQITSDDYDNDLSYNYRFPKLVYWDWEDNKEKTAWWDGSSFTVHSKKKNVSSLFTTTYQTGYRSLSYFGLWANVPNFKLCDFWFSMQWLYGARLTFDHQTTVVWENADKYSLIEGEILEIRPKSDKLGQKNYIQFNDEEEPLEISSIQNQWLQEKNTFHKSTFGMVDSYTSYIVVKQYSNPEHDPDSTEYKCDFNDINSLVIVRDDGTNLKKIELKDFNLNTLVQSMEVTIKTFTPQLRDKDIVYLDGRKYFVVSCKTDLDTQRSELVCLLVPNIVKTSFNFRQQNILNR